MVGFLPQFLFCLLLLISTRGDGQQTSSDFPCVFSGLPELLVSSRLDFLCRHRRREEDSDPGIQRASSSSTSSSSSGGLPFLFPSENSDLQVFPTALEVEVHCWSPEKDQFEIQISHSSSRLPGLPAVPSRMTGKEDRSLLPSFLPSFRSLWAAFWDDSDSSRTEGEEETPESDPVTRAEYSLIHWPHLSVLRESEFFLRHPLLREFLLPEELRIAEKSSIFDQFFDFRSLWAMLLSRLSLWYTGHGARLSGMDHRKSSELRISILNRNAFLPAKIHCETLSVQPVTGILWRLLKSQVELLILLLLVIAAFSLHRAEVKRVQVSGP